MLKDILAIVDTSDKDEQFISDAIAFAAAHDARLILGLLCAVPVPGYSAGFDLPYASSVAFNKAVEEKEKRIWSLSEQTGVTVRTFVDEPIVLLEKIAAQARIADLILFGFPQAYASARLRRDVIEDVVLSSGRPVIIHPAGAAAEAFSHIVVGWNGTREAARALHDALFLAPSKSVFDIVTVVDDSGGGGRRRASAADVVQHVIGHGHSASAHDVPPNGQSAARTLANFARDHHADLVAIGAYGHSRLREMLLGGVTRDLLDGCDVAILMDH